MNMPIVRHYHDNVLVHEIEIPSTVQDVKEEAQRRIIKLTGATDMTGCLIKQLNAEMRATRLTYKQAMNQPLTPEEEAEVKALQDMADMVIAIRAASDVIEKDPPLEVENDPRWP